MTHCCPSEDVVGSMGGVQPRAASPFHQGVFDPARSGREKKGGGVRTETLTSLPEKT